MSAACGFELGCGASGGGLVRTWKWKRPHVRSPQRNGHVGRSSWRVLNEIGSKGWPAVFPLAAPGMRFRGVGEGGRRSGGSVGEKAHGTIPKQRSQAALQHAHAPPTRAPVFARASNTGPVWWPIRRHRFARPFPTTSRAPQFPPRRRNPGHRSPPHSRQVARRTRRRHRGCRLRDRFLTTNSYAAVARSGGGNPWGRVGGVGGEVRFASGFTVAVFSQSPWLRGWMVTAGKDSQGTPQAGQVPTSGRLGSP